MTGITLMSAFLAAVAVLAGAVYFLTRLLPEAHPVRKGVNAAAAWVRENPRLFEKRLKQAAFALVVFVFFLLTVIYS